MKNMPRILPLIGVAMVGVLGVNALSGAQSLPDLMSGARAFAEEAAKGVKAPAGEKAATGEAKDAAATLPNLPPAAKPAAVCAPTAAELAKEAGLSPAELQVLQSLGARRGQLDKREQDLDVQLALMAAAEAKKLTEALASRFAEVKKVAAAAQAAAGPLPAAAPRAAGQAAAPPAKAG